MLGVLAGVVLGFLALQDLATHAPFSRYLGQARFIEGTLESILLTGLVFLSLRYLRWGLAVAVAALALYARRHAIDYAIIASSLYVAGILALGALARRSVFPESGRDTRGRLAALIECAVIGLASYSCFQWLVAACGANYQVFNVASWSIVLASIGGFAAVFKPWTWWKGVGSSLRNDSALGQFVVCALIVLALTALAKGNLALESDSAWYGLRPDRVLFSPAGVFGSPGLAFQVHYYPKSYELLSSPLAAIGENSGIPALGLWAWGLFVLCCAQFLRSAGASGPGLWAGVVVTGTLPAAMSISITAKGDIAAAALTLAGACMIERVARDGDRRALAVALSALLLAPFFRLSALPYVAPLGLVLVLAAAPHLARSPKGPLRSHAWLLVPAVALAGALLAMARTWMVSGLPFIAPGELQRLFVMLGAELKFPAGLATNWNHVPIPPLPGLLRDFLFSPDDLPHVRIYWIGNAWAVLLALGLAAVLLPRTRTRLDKPRVVAIAAASATASLFFLFLLTKHFGVRGGDGNYYVVPIALASLVGIALAGRFAGLVLGLCLGAGVIQVLVFMLTGLWSPGTRGFDLDFSQDPIDQDRFVQSRLEQGGLGHLGLALGACAKDTFALGLLPPPNAYLLPVRFEPIKQVNWGHPRYADSPSMLADYLRRVGADVVILPAKDAPKKFFTAKAIGSARLLEVARHAAQAGTRHVALGSFDLHALSPAGVACIEAGVDKLRAVPGGRIAEFRDANATVDFEVLYDPCARSKPSIVRWKVQPAGAVFTALVQHRKHGEIRFATIRGQGQKTAGRWVRPGTTFLVRNESGELVGQHVVADSVCIRDHRPGPAEGSNPAEAGDASPR